MKSAQSVSAKFAERASNASGDYGAGVASATKSQSGAAIAAADIWKQAVSQAANDGRYAKGLQKSGDAAWKKGVAEKGVNRFGEGVSQSAGKYAANSAKFDAARGAAASLPRGLKGSPANLSRVTAVVAAQIAAKKGA